MENLKRPIGDETDEDLLRQQEVFLKQNEKPSAKFICHDKKPTKTLVTETSEEKSVNNTAESVPEIVTSDILFDVKERDVISEQFVFEPPPVDPSEIIKVINKKVKLSKFASGRKGQSIFVQMLQSSEPANTNPTEGESVSTSSLIDGSGLVPEEKEIEMKKIHEENLAKLSSMSKEEILHHQEQLKNYLKPEIIEFLKKKRNVKKDEVLKCTSEVSNVSSKSKNNKQDIDLPGEILRKEGKEDCDAIILEKVLESEHVSLASQNQNSDCESSKEKSDNEIPDETKELIQESSKGLWRNMNKIEKEKLGWMTNLPQPKPVDLKTGYTARFDFEGKLLSRDEDIPTYKGLHHHGAEPEIPGYSLEELFLLARSSLQSQRITALNIIAHILENNWLGMMDKCFDSPLLPSLINAGIVPLLRWALDDTSLTSISATISAMHSLLISKADEICSNKTFCWLSGHFVAQLEPQGLDEPNIVIEELTDADLIKLDVVKTIKKNAFVPSVDMKICLYSAGSCTGLMLDTGRSLNDIIFSYECSFECICGFLRIDILPRFMYILKVMCPPPLVCKLIIEICARLAQHSPESAKQVAEYPNLFKLIFKKFLPLNWHFIDPSTLTDSVDYSCPMHSALKLMRIIASSSKELALDLVEKYDIIAILSFYLTVQPCDGKLAPQEVQLLVVETLKTWHTFLCYGYAFHIFLDLFPIFLKQLKFCLNLNLNSDVRKHLHDFDYASHLFKSFEAVTILAAELKDSGLELASAMNVIFKEAVLCFHKWIWQLSQEAASSHGMTLLGACMNFIVTHCRKSHEGLICENWKPCAAAKESFEKYLIPTMKSKTFQNLLRDFRSFSLYLNSDISGNQRDGETIVSLGSIIYGEDVVPNLKEGSPLPLLCATLNYVLFYKNSFHDSSNECIEILTCPAIIDYLKAISVKELNNNCWFLKFEIHAIFQLIQLSSFMTSADSSLCYEAAVSILPTFTLSEECLVEDLFENIIFNQSVIPKLTLLLTSSKSNESDSLHSLVSRLPVIAQCYICSFLSKTAISRSRSMVLRNSAIDSLFCLSSPNRLVPKDWCFMPIFNLYRKAKSKKEERSLIPEESLQIASSLQWIYLCHLVNLTVLRKIPASAEFYYLCQVFLLDEDLFRDDKIKTLLIKCVSIILKNKKLQLTKIKWNNINTFEDIYLEMLIQYEAVSYGDETFGNFMAIPLQQCYPSQWKKLLFTEHVPVLNFLRLPLSKLLVPLQNFLEPIETDYSLLLEYFKALASGCLNHRRCPLVYLMAVHHIHNFIFVESDIHSKNKKMVLSSILKSRKELQRRLLLYSSVNVSSEFGFDLTDELSPEKKNYLSNIVGVNINL